MTKFTTEIGFKGHATPTKWALPRGLPARGGHLVFGYFFARMARNTDPFYGANRAGQEGQRRPVLHAPSWPRPASTSPSCCPTRRPALIRSARAGCA
jgi:hypothetical protein